MADGRLTDPQLHTRFGEAEMARRCLERAQRIKRQMGLCQCPDPEFSNGGPYK
jgi:hypothetical protein